MIRAQTRLSLGKGEMGALRFGGYRKRGKLLHMGCAPMRAFGVKGMGETPKQRKEADCAASFKNGLVVGYFVTFSTKGSHVLHLLVPRKI